MCFTLFFNITLFYFRCSFCCYYTVVSFFSCPLCFNLLLFDVYVYLWLCVFAMQIKLFNFFLKKKMYMLIYVKKHRYTNYCKLLISTTLTHTIKISLSLIFIAEKKIICDCLQSEQQLCVSCADNFRVVQWTFNVRRRACALVLIIVISLFCFVEKNRSRRSTRWQKFNHHFAVCVHQTDNRWILDDFALLVFGYFFFLANCFHFKYYRIPKREKNLLFVFLLSISHSLPCNGMIRTKPSAIWLYIFSFWDIIYIIPHWSVTD